MEIFTFQTLFAVLVFCIPGALSWGIDGHLIICRLAQPRLSKAAEDAVSQLLPSYAQNDLGSVCSWADRVKFHYHWSKPLHYLNTPDNLCTYQYRRDCKDEDGIPDRCVAGAINNYTSQLLSYGSSSASSGYNLTEALLFLSHFIGDIHQPLHVGFTRDREQTPLTFIGTGGNKFFIMYGITTSSRQQRRGFTTLALMNLSMHSSGT